MSFKERNFKDIQGIANDLDKIKTNDEVFEYYAVFMEKFRELNVKDIVLRKLLQERNEEKYNQINSDFYKFKDYSVLLEDDQFNNHDSYVNMMKKGTRTTRKSRRSCIL